MKAIAITRTATDNNNIEFLQEIDLSMPITTGHDLLVEVKAISVNLVGTKVREGFNTDVPRVLGWDAVGMVKSVGEAVIPFSPGDEVWYAGALDRAGNNSESQLVDERIAVLRPEILDGALAAAPPLTAITARKMLLDRLSVEESGNEGDVLLIVGTAGGVGSILTQLVNKLTKMIIIGTTSRPQNQKRVYKADAHHVIDHNRPLTEELVQISIKGVTHITSLNNTEQHHSQIIIVLAPRGKLVLIDDPQALSMRPLKAKGISLHWEFMFTRPMFTTHDIIVQHQLSTRVVQLTDDSTLRTTLGEHFGTIIAANL